MGATFPERERRILADIERQLGQDRRLERRLRTGRIGLRGVWYQAAVLTAVALLLAVVSIGLTAAGTRAGLSGLLTVSALTWSLTVLVAVRAVGLHLATRRRER